ncbi:GGDEF domain-containing protein [Vibrio hannami]|uniref:GGDEF domain-containing protein n=1 Tax=Vibrio hannami TaxID=2717094 RepID=UPI00240ECDBE|nr:diguanylate cyclase [Vibrio hannami]MDG3085622.1 GGDEF domain-containing protein [Vibrio hannami]
MFPNTRVEKYYKLCSELLDFSGLSWWIIDLDDNSDVFYCNQTMCDTFHLDSSLPSHSVSQTCPIAGDYNKYIAISSSDKAKQIFNEYRELRNNDIYEYDNRFPYYDADKDKVCYFTSRAKALVRDKNGKATLLLGVIEPETISEELYKLASIDSLTGLKNRRTFDSQLLFLMNLARREHRYISLIFCDIDHFKKYNDSLGHYAGDECLKKVAQALSDSCTRETDIVCRYGGEEFAFIIYGENPDTFAFAEKVRTNVRDLAIPHPDPEIDIVTISAGYFSVIPDETTTPKSLIEKADCGLYVAKHNGRNKTENCNCSLEEMNNYANNQ